MATTFSKISLRSGQCTAKTFSQSGCFGDWQRFNVAFYPAMPTAAVGKIRVLATASDTDANTFPLAPVTPVVGEISPGGFTAWVRNSDIVSKRAGLNWIAIAEVPENNLVAMSAVSGLVLPQPFASAAHAGDWNICNVPFPLSRQFTAAPVVVATPANANVRVHAAAVIPIACASTIVQFSLAVRNSDCGPGFTSLNYLAIGPGQGMPANIMIDTGRVAPRCFARGGSNGDWQMWQISFADHFLVPPTVLITADNFDGKIPTFAVAAVPVANDVTPYGFTLAARNSDISSGWVAFSWVAIGYRNG